MAPEQFAILTAFLGPDRLGVVMLFTADDGGDKSFEVAFLGGI